MKDKLKNSLTLFLTFFKIGAFTFGGGYAMIPIIEKEIVEKYGKVTAQGLVESALDKVKIIEDCGLKISVCRGDPK